MAAPRAGLVAKKVTVQGRRGKTHQQTVWVKPDSEHAAYVKEHGRGAKAGSQFTPETAERLRALGVKKLPPAYVKPSDIGVNLSGNLNRHALITWRDQRGKLQSEYSAEFHRRNAAEKWARVQKLRPKADAALEHLASQAPTSDAHAAGLIIAHTGLRVGGNASLANHERYGVTTMEARHVTLNRDGTATIRYVGKAGKENVAHVVDPHAVEVLRSRVEGRAPRDRVFNTRDENVRAAMPAGVHPKDFRTLVATRTAERTLDATRPPPPLTGEPKADMRTVLRAMRVASEATARAINNTPAVARSSYIHPNVFHAWARRIGAPASWIEG